MVKPPVSPEPTGKKVESLLEEIQYETDIPPESLRRDLEHHQKFWNGEQLPRESQDGSLVVKTSRLLDAEGWAVVTVKYHNVESRYIVRQHPDEVAEQIGDIERMQAP